MKRKYLVLIALAVLIAACGEAATAEPTPIPPTPINACKIDACIKQVYVRLDDADDTLMIEFELVNRAGEANVGENTQLSGDCIVLEPVGQNFELLESLSFRLISP